LRTLPGYEKENRVTGARGWLTTWSESVRVDKNKILRYTGIFILALGLRIGVLATTQSTEINTRWCPTCGDVSDYNALAINILKNHQYQQNGQSVAERPPLYPAFIALVYEVAGIENYGAVRWIQVFLSAITVVLLSHMAERLFGPSAAWITGGLLAIYPFLLIFSVELYSETLFTFLVSCAMWLLFPYPNQPGKSFKVGIVGGLLIGISALTRELAILMLPALTLSFWVFQRRLWARWLVVLWLSAGAVIGVWTVRNYLIWGQLIPLTTHTFSNIVHGLVDDYGHYLDGATATVPADVPAGTVNPFAWLGQNNQVEQEQFSRQLVLSYCTVRPDVCLETWTRNLIKLVNPVVSNRSLAIVIPTALIHSLVWVFGIVGLFQLVREKRPEIPFFLLIWFGLCLGVSALAHVEVRYRMPVIDPYLIVIGSYPLSKLWQSWRNRPLSPNAAAS
jgi:4-amino-4-deoxy-L-arabinose transferase-like glycosyltransferase